ncbi:helix-turn-helix domain-containing protein, partial [Glutamicibacter creatinolyticus]
MHSPSRELILHLLQEANEALSIPQLAQAAGMHENTVRAQLEALLRDGYVR